jgi:hypothetical protein
LPRTSPSTPLTGELKRLPNADARPLLAEFTEEQLGQYRRIAADQVIREERWRAVQWTVGIAAAALAVWLVEGGVTSGFSGLRLTALGILSLAGYWPWRTNRSRAQWQAHVDAVDTELAKRKAGAGSKA